MKIASDTNGACILPPLYKMNIVTVNKATGRACCPRRKKKNKAIKTAAQYTTPPREFADTKTTSQIEWRDGDRFMIENRRVIKLVDVGDISQL
jgi:hypothetical protein